MKPDPFTQADAETIARAAWGPYGFASGTHEIGVQYGTKRRVKGRSSRGWGDAIQDALMQLRSGTAYRSRFIAATAAIQNKYIAEGKI